MTAYSLSKAKMLPNGAFFANIKKGTKVVGTVENSGRGGSDITTFLNQAERAAFTVEARNVMGAEVNEVEDAFVNRLLFIFEVNKVRSGVVTIKSFEDFYEQGIFSVLRNKDYTNDAIANAVKNQTPDRLLWNKTRQEFIPASQW